MDAGRQGAASHIVVVGAGVIGLQTALTLLEAGYAVTIVAERWPDHAAAMEDPTWASPWAGAQWRAHASRGSEAAAWEARTYHAWTKQTDEESAAGFKPGCGPSSLAALPFEHYWHANTQPAPSPPWWSIISPSSFEELPAKMLPPETAYGVRMRSFSLEPQRYMNHLLARVRSLGGTIIQARVNIPPTNGQATGSESAVASFLEAVENILPRNSPPVAAYINATGLAAGKLVADPQVFPNRGQTMLVQGAAHSMRTMVGAKPTDVLAVIPRPGAGTTIVGATRGPGREDTAANVDERHWLMKEGSKLAPELINSKSNSAADDFGFTVLKTNVGFRPRREGGARVEREDFNGKVVIHAYGHDGAGYQQSIGSAEKVLQLLRTGRESKL